MKVNSSSAEPDSTPFLDSGGGMVPPGFMEGGATTRRCSFFSFLVVTMFAGLIAGFAFVGADIAAGIKGERRRQRMGRVRS